LHFGDYSNPRSAVQAVGKMTTAPRRQGLSVVICYFLHSLPFIFSFTLITEPIYVFSVQTFPAKPAAEFHVFFEMDDIYPLQGTRANTVD
jgi:hypothetical protein